MTFIQTIRQRVTRAHPEAGLGPDAPASAAPVAIASPPTATAAAIEIVPSDPLFAVLQATSGVVEIDRLEIDSPALRDLRAAGMRLVVPLVAQGELIGALYLGPRLSDQEYSSDDRKLLSTLAAQAAPAIRVAQLVREQAAEIQVRERLEQEMRVATMIQQQFLPHELPQLPDWQVAAYYAPARAVGGDFYDFIDLSDGRIGLVVGDVTGKGVPAALLMARTQSILRGEAPRLISPSKVLQRANDILITEMPPRMFVTCLYMVLEPSTGRVAYANAGHNLPIVRTSDGVIELRATGMPLGLLPDRLYDEKEAVLGRSQSLLLYSDGIDEAHDPSGAMFGTPRLRGLMAAEVAGSELIDHLLDALHQFVGRDWDQEDDITLVALERTGAGDAMDSHLEPRPQQSTPPETGGQPASDGNRVLLRLTIPGAEGNERMAMDGVAEAVAPLGLEGVRLERLKTAVSEAAMNAIEYGSKSDPAIPVDIEVALANGDLVVRITDRGLGGGIPAGEEPNLEAKLAGEQKPRGWGLFLIRHMVDTMEVVTEGPSQTVTLTLHLEGDGHANQPV
jgi:serine phosphatase RsbU (regulator of sigma subunit)/anti-sigma regulatory factor (Ser/Thr protein kinase)